jgi:hypothetical protein
MSPHIKSSLGENLVACLIAGVAAVLAVVVGIVGAIFLCGRLLSGEMTEWDLILAPVTGLIFGIAAFVFVFRKIVTYGDDPDSLR